MMPNRRISLAGPPPGARPTVGRVGAPTVLGEGRVVSGAEDGVVRVWDPDTTGDP
jgi:hypothetical protein